MKAIILLIAVLACATASLNHAQFYAGFSTKLGFTQQHHTELKACGAEIAVAAKTYLAPGKAALKAKLVGLLFADDAKHKEALIAIAQYAQTALPACRKFAHTFTTVFAKASLSKDEVHINAHSLIKYRLQKYSAEIISTLATLPELHRQGNDAKVGETVAHLLQIVTGVDHPESIIEYVQNYKQPVEVSVLEQDRYLVQVINTVAQELGLTARVTEQRAKEFINAVQGLVVVYIQTNAKIHNAKSVVEREVAVLAAVRDFVKAAAVVKENVALTFGPLAANVHVNRKEVSLTIVKMASNYLKNLPAVQKRGVDLMMGIKAHHPVQTGKAIAGVIKAYLGKL